VILDLAASISLAALAGLVPISIGAAPTPPTEVERLESWPEISTKERREIELNVQRLRKARSEDMEEEAVDLLEAAGAACAPELLDALGAEKKQPVRAKIERLLTAMTGPEHTRLLARELDDSSADVRIFCLRRAARFPDETLRELAIEHLESTLANLEKKRRGSRPEEGYAAALFAASTGATQGLAPLFAHARDDWKARAEELRAALIATRGPEASTIVIGLASADDPRSIEAALRMLWDCGDPDKGAKYAAEQLYHDNPVVRMAAVNALRCIVDGDPVLEDISVFDGIQLADAWKRRM